MKQEESAIIKKSDIVSTLEKYNLNKKINSKTILVVNSYFNKDNDLKEFFVAEK